MMSQNDGSVVLTNIYKITNMAFGTLIVKSGRSNIEQPLNCFFLTDISVA